MSQSLRRYPRYPANLRLRLHLPTGEIETTTEEIGLGGFSAPCTPMPQIGTRFEFAVHLPDKTQVGGTVAVVRGTPDGLAGFSADFNPGHRGQWEAFVEQEAGSGGVWRMIGRYALNQGEEKEAARSVLEKGPLGILFKKIGKGEEAAEETPAVMRLHMVGENGEAYRVAFAKHEGVTPEESDLAASVPGFLELARLTVARVLPHDVYLKRSQQAQVQPARLVELKRGGFGLVAQHPSAPPSLVGLHGSELIVIELDGKSVFPNFTPTELDRIALDNFRRAPPPVPGHGPALAAVVPVSEERFAPSYEHKEVATSVTKSGYVGLRDAMAITQRTQTRQYGERTMRLFPDLWIEASRPTAWEGPVRGFAMEDGLLVCLFVLVGKDAPRVVRLDPGDEISILRPGKKE